MDRKSSVRGTLSILTGVLLGLILLIEIFWVPVQKVLLQPDVYKQAFQDQGFYRLTPLLVTSFMTGDESSNLLGNSLSQLTSQLDQLHLNQLVLSIIPPDWIQQQVNSNLDKVFAFLHGSGDSISLGVDLSGIKTSLGQAESIQGLIQMLPACTATDLTKLLSLFGGDKDIPFCRFPDEVMGIVNPIVQPFVLNMVNQIPDQIPLISFSLHSSGIPSTVVTFVNLVRNSTVTSTILILLSVLLLTALIWVSSPGWRIKIRNCGIVLLAAGSAGLVMDFLLWLGSNSGAANLIHSATSALPGEIGEVITGIYLQIANNFVMVAALTGFVVLTCGVILFVISRTMFKDQASG